MRLDILTDSSARLIMLANGGPTFWRAFAQCGIQGADPVDAFSRQLALRFAETYLQCPASILYPGSRALPLQQLGALVGWHHPSPLGIGIHPKYGLWFAYRAVLLVHADLPVSPLASSASPCAACIERSCLSACPVQALAQPGKPDIQRCQDWRRQTNSRCAATCLSRLACPLGAEHRYTDAQIRYHYGHSLANLMSAKQ